MRYLVSVISHAAEVYDGTLYVRCMRMTHVCLWMCESDFCELHTINLFVRKIWHRIYVCSWYILFAGNIRPTDRPKRKLERNAARKPRNWTNSYYRVWRFFLSHQFFSLCYFIRNDEMLLERFWHIAFIHHRLGELFFRNAF